jgi:pimeloyl-ACP methyl ester carboxylesterase
METESPQPTLSKQPRSMRQRVRRAIVLYILLPYFGVTIIFAVLQRRLMYQPTVAESLSITDLGLDGDFGIDVELTTADGNTICGWLISGTGQQQQDRSKAALVLYFPGNSLNRYERIADLRAVAARGFDVLILDYRGFGDSTGSPTESALSADALLVWQYARENLGYDERRIVVFGESIGGAVALSMWSETNASPPQPAALILNSTFASMPQTVGWHYPLFPFQFLLLDRWPSIERIGRVQAPIIVFHGTDVKWFP